jgi:hypothetical protein
MKLNVGKSDYIMGVCYNWILQCFTPITYGIVFATGCGQERERDRGICVWELSEQRKSRDRSLHNRRESLQEVFLTSVTSHSSSIAALYLHFFSIWRCQKKKFLKTTWERASERAWRHNQSFNVQCLCAYLSDTWGAQSIQLDFMYLVRRF